MTLPSTTGFVVGIEGPPPAAPSLAMSGQRVTVDIRGGGLHASGWAIQGDPGAAIATASGDGVTVLLAGELHHRGSDDIPEIGDIPEFGDATATLTDAEFLLACWQHYGRAGLRLIQGRFCVVILDAGAVVAATDHAGSIPLYLRVLAGSLEVATEAKALGGASAGRNPGVTAIPGTAPVPGLADVRRVRAGTAVTVVPSSGAKTAMRTWSPPQHREMLAPAKAVARLSDALTAAVCTRLDDGPVTVVLSGGIDSSAVAALTKRHAHGTVTTVSLGTDAGDEFDAARLVAEHLGTTHHELRVGSEQVIRALPWAVAAAEMVDAEVLEYLLPLVVLYQQLPGGPRRILTGYGADIPLGGMHRDTDMVGSLDDVIAHDMATFDGLNEMSPVIGGTAGHWTTHPFWDRSVLDLLVRLEPGLKRREGIDKWVLRAAVADLLPEQTVRRPKLGIHEGSGTTSTWTAMLKAEGLPDERVAAAKRAMVEAIHRRVNCEGEPPALVDVDEVLRDAIAADRVVAT